MATFANPYVGDENIKLTDKQLMQAIRLDIAGELEAIYVYEAHILATDNPAAIKVLSDIRDEEKSHMGELITLMRYLDPEEMVHFLDGEEEVRELLGIDADGNTVSAATVGSLKED